MYSFSGGGTFWLYVNVTCKEMYVGTSKSFLTFLSVGYWC